MSWVGKPGLSWVIAGGESGPGARPMHPQWARDIRDQCQEAGVPYFFKQWGEWAPFTDAPRNGDFVIMADPYNPYNRILDGVPERGMLWNPDVHGRANGFIDHFGSAFVRKQGKKAAGALLDGREWREMPAG